MEENQLSGEKENTTRRKMLDKMWADAYLDSKKTIPQRIERRLKPFWAFHGKD